LPIPEFKNLERAFSAGMGNGTEAAGDHAAAGEVYAAMKVTISRPVNAGGYAPRNRYITDENGKALEAGSVKEAINFLADRNYTINDLREVDFHVEEETD
jgi:hypothetical protein